MDHLISKYITQELNEDESRILKGWLEEDPLHREVFENIVGAKHISHNDILNAKETIRRRIEIPNQPDRKTIEESDKKGIHHWHYIRRLAAILLMGLISYGVWYTYWVSDKSEISVNDTVHMEKEAPAGRKVTFQLPDGTSVKLNSSSHLTYLEDPNTHERHVNLIGEAFFDVARDVNRPFVIHAKTLKIKVLGTSFNVKAFPEEINSVVAVTSGKVAVSDNELRFDSRDLLPGQMLSYSEISGKAMLSDFQIDEQIGWKENILFFREKSFDEVINQLGRWYGVTFHVDKSFGLNKKITGNFKQASLEEVLHSLSIAYDFEYEINNKSVMIND
ncbi:MAG: DUF4974 domain-containing protein [Cyclobacteriaceae bacterium]